MTPFTEVPKVEESAAPVEAPKPAIEAKPKATKITQPKVVKIPDLGDKLLAGRYKVAVLKAGKTPEEVAKMVDEDAQTLAKRVMDGDDSEAVKLGKLQHIHEQQRFLKGKALAEEFGKTSGLAKTAKQGMKRPETFGENAVRGLKEKERVAASGSTKSRLDAFVTKFGRSPEPDEDFILTTTDSTPEEAVNLETQEDFEQKVPGGK